MNDGDSPESEEFSPEAGRAHLRRKPRAQLGDVLAKGAGNSLIMGAECEFGYPGDGWSEDENAKYRRFLVYRISDTHHTIMDALSEVDTLIESEFLADPDFELPRWYAAQRGRDKGWSEGRIR